MEYDPASGKRLRMGDASLGYGGLAFIKNLMFQSGNRGQYGTGGGTVLDLNDAGKEPYKYPTLEDVRLMNAKPLPVAAMATPLSLGDKVCFATTSGEAILMTPDGKKLWSAKLGGTCHAPPVAADGLLVVGCDDGNVYAFREKAK
jgi:outer membrane protein assembly factor BamB